jgi:methylmalonyl-CoA mutase N-terminal domain/subunit
VADTVDPLAGSYLIEHLTDEIEAEAEAYIKKIDEMGGALAAIEQGYVQGQIQEASYSYQQEMEAGEQVVVGVNAYEMEEELDIERLKVDPAIEATQRAKLEALRAGRDNEKVSELKSQLASAAQGDSNLMPLFIECVENDMTLGEICHTLRDVWGEYRPSTWI